VGDISDTSYELDIVFDHNDNGPRPGDSLEDLAQASRLIGIQAGRWLIKQQGLRSAA
jgi:hypothetical protein